MANAIRKIAPILALIGIGFWAYYCYDYITGAPLFLTTPTGNTNTNVWSQVGLAAFGFAVLLIGVFLGAVYNQIKAERANEVTQIDIGAVTKTALKTPDFWLGIFAAPVVYVILLQAVDLDTPTTAKFLALTLVGLQNGFVCNTIADALINKQTHG